MKIELFNLEKGSEGKVDLPVQFNELISPSLIRRAVVAFQLNKRQHYGANPEAGTRVSAKVSRRRRNYRGSYGKGISRVPRKVLSRRGSQFFWQGALAPGTVKGRRAHPPKAYQTWFKKINKKENSKAIRSSLAASMEAGFVKGRGHNLPEDYPFAVNDSFASLDKTKLVKQTLEKLGFKPELSRTTKKTLRAGRGKARGRKYSRKTGLLIVVSDKCPLQKSAANIPGTDVVLAEQLNAELLAPGAVPGRLTLFTASAINKIKSDKLFM